MTQTPDRQIEVEVFQSIDSIGAENWDACACPEAAQGARPIDPFTSFRFLSALEHSGSVGQNTGWYPNYIAVKLDGAFIGVAPSYLKSHSQGEYIFDFNFASAFENAGGKYYPKLQIALPFTPATGRRLLVVPEHAELAQTALLQTAQKIVQQNNLSSLHITFCTKAEAALGPKLGLLPRASQQFHWRNENYTCFDDFLLSLSSRKRKNIRKERQIAQQFGGEIMALTGDQITPEHWDAFWQFYQDTGARKWGTPYLTRSFFDHAQKSLRDDIYLLMARRDGQYVAGALNFIGRDSLFGRYWGCTEDHSNLHFEMCYYQAMDYAIKNKLQYVEAGAQGQHKLARGYLPCQTHSLHWFSNPDFHGAVAEYLKEERTAVGKEIDFLTDFSPFKKTP